MIRFETKTYPVSTLSHGGTLPTLSYNREKGGFKSIIDSYDGLYIGYGYREHGYPYTEQSLYEEETMQDVRVAVLENDYLYAEFLVDYGARLWVLKDKKTGKDIVFTNDVIRMRNLALRNAWFAGGVEWNIGVIGHTPFTCAPMYCATLKSKSGKDVLRFYEFERVREIYFQLDFWLEKDVLMVGVHIENPNGEVVPMYWWSNIATPETAGGRLVVPADNAYNNSDGLGIKKSNIPLDDGVDVSYPENIPNTMDYFYNIDEKSNKFIANVDKDGQGLLQFSSNKMKGRKLFSWGHRPGSDSWQKTLTGNTANYIEAQAGLGKTQYECLPMPPKTYWSFVECYTLADIGEAENETYENLVSSANKQVESLYSSNTLDNICKEVYTDISLVKGELKYSGSGFGYLQDELVKSAPKHLEFTPQADIDMWINLLDNGKLQGEEFTFSFGASQKQLLLKNKDTMQWQVPYQLGLLAYDERDFETALKYAKEAMLLDHNTRTLHLYASVLYQLKDDKFDYYAKRALGFASSDFYAAESLFRLLIAGEKYKALIESFENFSETLAKNPRMNMYLSRALYEVGEVDKAEEKLCGNGGLILTDYREGDTFLPNLYREIRHTKYGEKYEEIEVPKQFDFIVSDAFKLQKN